MSETLSQQELGLRNAAGKAGYGSGSLCLSLPATSQSLQPGQPQLGRCRWVRPGLPSRVGPFPSSSQILGITEERFSPREARRTSAVSCATRLPLGPSWTGSWVCFFKLDPVTSPTSFLPSDSESSFFNRRLFLVKFLLSRE